MANTRSATLSIRLKAGTKRRLAKLAEASGRSSNFLISDAVESYVADQERLLAEMRQAERLATRIVSVVEALRIHPYLGRVGPEPGIRELIIGGTPYSILYRVRANRLVISTISHALQSN